jgi:hypothetical protein
MSMGDHGYIFNTPAATTYSWKIAEGGKEKIALKLNNDINDNRT